MVVVDNVSKYFSHLCALKDISCKIMPGSLTGVVGPDGAGKTTLMRLLVGLLKPTAGQIEVGSFDSVKNANQIHQITGYMPQKFGLYEDLTVMENLELYASLRSLSNKARKEKFTQLLELTDLKKFSKRLAGNLSGGMKQKLGLACVLLGNPQVLFLDEPTVGVDPISRIELWKMVKSLLAQGIAIVWSTSYLDEAERCSNVILLHEGLKLYDGPPKDLLKQIEGRVWNSENLNQDEKRNFLSQLLESNEVIDAIVQGNRVRFITKTAIKSKYCLAEPRLEDAFINLLGGVACKNSLLVDHIREKPFLDRTVVEAQNLTKNFNGFVAVKNNSFQIKRGEIFGLLGPNGAGKSTTFRMMCGLLQPSDGRSLVNGDDLRSSNARSKVGYMAQKFSLYGHLNILQNLKFFSGLYGLSGKAQKKQIDLVIDMFAFAPYLKINAALLPLGVKQRLSLACAIMHQPDVLFLDEPTSGVDPLTRREFWMHINSMAAKGLSIMVTTHFMDEAEYCDRIGLIYKGINIATGSPDQLKKLASSHSLPNPTLEDAFIELIKKADNP